MSDNDVFNTNGVIQFKGGTKEILDSENIWVYPREIVIEEDTNKMKTGDDVHDWVDLPYAGGLKEEIWELSCLDGTSTSKKIVLWGNNYSINILQKNNSPIRGLQYGQQWSKDFTVIHNLPDEYLENNSFSWSVKNLPKELVKSVSDDGLTMTLSGYLTTYGTKTMTITVSIGECSETKSFQLVINYDSNVPHIEYVSSDPVILQDSIINLDDKTYSHKFKIVNSNNLTYSNISFGTDTLPSGYSKSSSGGELTIRGKAPINANGQSIKIWATCKYNGITYRTPTYSAYFEEYNVMITKRDNAGYIYIDATDALRNGVKGTYTVCLDSIGHTGLGGSIFNKLDNYPESALSLPGVKVSSSTTAFSARLYNKLCKR